LLPNAVEGEKRGLALEVLRATLSVRATIRQGRTESIESAIQTGRRDGMITLDENLARLAANGTISWETARLFAKDPESISQYNA
jgi:twitching motility protein PilT